MAKDLETLLKHYGVKGMKWGVRNDKGHEGERAKTKTIEKADKKYDKSFQGSGGYFKLHNAFAEQTNKRLDALNAKYKDSDIKDGSPGQKKYFKDYEKLVDDALVEAGNSFGTNASGTTRVKMTRVGNGLESTWFAEFEDIKHAATTPKFKITPKFNDKGFIVSQKIELVSSELEQSDDLDDFLSHYGVKGMRWGKRREKHLNSLKRTAEGNGSFKDKYVAINSVSAIDLVRGKGFQGALKIKISELEDRKARTAEGKSIAGDILSDMGLVGFASLGKKKK